MKTETITRTVLTADDGKVLTDGKSFGKKVYLAEGADASVWREVDESYMHSEGSEEL